MKRMEFEELQRQITEDFNADMACECLDDQAREAQRLQEEAHRARKALLKQFDSRRRLKKTENDLEIAQLVTSFLRAKEDESQEQDESN